MSKRFTTLLASILFFLALFSSCVVNKSEKPEDQILLSQLQKKPVKDLSKYSNKEETSFEITAEIQNLTKSTFKIDSIIFNSKKIDFWKFSPEQTNFSKDTILPKYKGQITFMVSSSEKTVPTSFVQKHKNRLQDIGLNQEEAETNPQFQTENQSENNPNKNNNSQKKEAHGLFLYISSKKTSFVCSTKQ